MSRRAWLALVATVASVLVAVPAAEANTGRMLCPDAKLFGTKLISGVCWSCMFPVYIAGARLVPGRNPAPAGASDRWLCYCGGDLSRGEMPTIGYRVGMWAPTRLVEVVRKPWCFPSLFGMDLSNANLMDGALAFGGQGTYDASMNAEANAFFSWHMYSFPLMEILSLLNVPKCNPDQFTSFDLLFFSEAFPHWYDGPLAFLINPEALLFGNPIAQSAQLADCTAASAAGPLNDIFWTAGCWGNHYPLTGHVGTGSNAMTASLTASRALFMLGRLGFMKRTIGNDALCEPRKMPVLTKNQFRFQQLFPVPEASNDDTTQVPAPINTAPGNLPPNAAEPTVPAGATSVPKMNIRNVRGGCCHNLGENTMLWGEWRQRPATGQDFVYLLWQWVDCCAGTLGTGG